jgi:2-(1,2-epoxy-1,2-dihydrophenyl)acetyl-CoA isomerase
VTSQHESVILELNGPLATITLNRPDALNAFDRDLALRLDAALRTVERDRAIRAVIITGAGRAFSAGQDVRELAAETAERGPSAVGDQLRERFNPIVLRLRSMEKPVIAAINGVTTGAGLGIALAADFRLAAETATFVLSPFGVGLVPAVGTTMLLPALIGLGRATSLALLGERITAEQANQAGLLYQVTTAGELMPEASALAERLIALPGGAVGLTKRALNKAMLPDLAAHLAYEAMLQEVAAGTADHAEGLAAVLEKRKPEFTSR